MWFGTTFILKFGELLPVSEAASMWHHTALEMNLCQSVKNANILERCFLNFING